MKLKSILIAATAFISLFAITAYIALTRIEYTPSDAVAFSNRYLALLMEGNAAEAYKLTEKNSVTGLTFDAFRVKINRECTRYEIITGKTIVLTHIFPRQTYGNRLRRLVHGRNPDMESISVDYHIGGVPFEIRLTSRGNGKFAVINFQTHAE